LTCEWACFIASRFGKAALNVARTASLMLAAKNDSGPAAARVARVPSTLLTVSSIGSYRPVPLPASVNATAQPCFRPHSPAVAIAP